MSILMRFFVLQAAGGVLFAQQLGTFNGLVLSDKNPVVDAQVEAKNLSTKGITPSQTDSDGRFTIEALPPGKYQFSVTPVGLPTVNWDITVAAGAQSRTLTITSRILQIQETPLGPKRKPPPPSVPETPQVADRSAKVVNGGSISVISTAFGLLIALLKDTGIPPAGNTLLSVEFLPLSLNNNGPQSGKLEIAPKPRPDAHVKFELQSAPPVNSVGNQVWVWALKASDDFNGTEVMVDVAMTLSDKKLKVLANGSATTPPLSLAHLDKPSWIATYKDVLGPITAAVITGVFGFFAGGVHKKHQVKKATVVLESRRTEDEHESHEETQGDVEVEGAPKPADVSPPPKCN